MSAGPNAEARAPARSSGRPFALRPRRAQPTLTATPALPPPPRTLSAWACMDPHGGPRWHVSVHLAPSHRPPSAEISLPEGKGVHGAISLPAPISRPPHSGTTGRTGHRSHPGAFLVGLEGGRLPGQTDCAGSRGFTDLNDMEAGGWVRCASALEHAGALLHTRVVVWARPE